MTSTGSCRQGINVEMTCTVYVALIWNIICWIMMIMIIIMIMMIMIMPWWPGGGDCVAVWTPLVFGYPSTTVSISQQPMREVVATRVRLTLTHQDPVTHVMSLLVQMMVCYLIIAKPSTKPIDILSIIWVGNQFRRIKKKHFHTMKWIWKDRLQSIGHNIYSQWGYNSRCLLLSVESFDRSKFT